MSLTARLVWRDAQSATRFASVRIRNLSEDGAYVECLGGTAIPLFRLVYLQTERPTDQGELPPPLRRGRVLAAVFRIEAGGVRGSVPCGYGLRLLAEPTHRAAGTRTRVGSRVPLRASAGAATA